MASVIKLQLFLVLKLNHIVQVAVLHTIKAICSVLAVAINYFKEQKTTTIFIFKELEKESNNFLSLFTKRGENYVRSNWKESLANRALLPKSTRIVIESGGSMGAKV